MSHDLEKTPAPAAPSAAADGPVWTLCPKCGGWREEGPAACPNCKALPDGAPGAAAAAPAAPAYAAFAEYARTAAPRAVTAVAVVKGKAPIDAPALVGQTVRSRPSISMPVVIFGTLAVALGALGFAPNMWGWWLPASLCLCLAVALWLTGDPNLAFTFTETGIRTDDGPVELRYAGITGIAAPQRPAVGAAPPHFAIAVAHIGGTLRIPARLDVASDDVYRFLLSRLPDGTSGEIPDVLADYYREQVAVYGLDRVVCYRSRGVPAAAGNPRRAAAICLAIVAAGIGWVIAGSAMRKGYQSDRDGVIGGGVCAIFIGLLSWGIAAAAQRGRNTGGVKLSGASFLIVGPGGIGLVQGDMKGRLNWGEVRGLKPPGTGSFRWNAASACLQIQVEGAKVVVPEIYDRPLETIWRHMDSLWWGGSGGANRGMQ